MVALLDRAAAQGATLCVFPELAFTAFFPRWYLEGAELDQYYEPAMPNPRVRLTPGGRVLSLQDVKLVCVGYNSAAYDPIASRASNGR